MERKRSRFMLLALVLIAAMSGCTDSDGDGDAGIDAGDDADAPADAGQDGDDAATSEDASPDGADAALLPEDCPGNALAVEIGDETATVAAPSAWGYPGRIVVQPAPAESPRHTLTIYHSEALGSGETTLPTAGVSFSYQRLQSDDDVWVASDDSVGGTALVGNGSGTIDVLHVSDVPGEPICGTFDLQLSWSDLNARITGSFSYLQDETPTR